MPTLSDVERRVLRRLVDAARHGPSRQPVTVEALGDDLAVDRRVLDHALRNLDDLGLVRIRGGGLSTHRSDVELTGAVPAWIHEEVRE